MGRLKRVGEVRDSRGLRTLIADTVTGMQGDKLIGQVEVNLESLPASGSDRWWKLTKVEQARGRRDRGEVRLALHLYRREGRLAEHTKLLRVLLSRELVQRAPPPYAWRDHFTPSALQILAQHAVQARMSRVETALTRLVVYTELHTLLPLDCRVFPPILQKLRGPVLAGSLSTVLVEQFHEAARRLATSFTAFIRQLRARVGGQETRGLVQLEAVLDCLRLLHTLQWRTRNDIVLQVEDALLAGLREWFAFVIGRLPKEEGSRKGRMRNLTRLTHLLVADLEESRRLYEKTFKESLNISYLEIAYREFDCNLTSIAKDVIDEACDGMAPILYSEEEGPSLKPSLTVCTNSSIPVMITLP